MSKKCLQCQGEAKIKGLCKYHYWQNLKQKSIKKNPLKRTYKPKERDENGLTALQVWYQFHISKSKWICENCRTVINPYSEQIKYATQAHILPKEHFTSISINLDNHLLLGVECGCHSKWDLSWESASKMQVVSIAKERFVRFERFISAAEQRRIPNFLIRIDENKEAI